MNVLMAVTKKRRNLMRIEQAFRTERNEAIRKRDDMRLTQVQLRRLRLVDAVERSFKADCKAVGK